MMRVVLTLFASVAGAAAGFAETPGALTLPPEECVRMLRTARISHMYGDFATELENLRAAAEAFPREIAPIYALLEYHRDHGLAAEEEAEVRALLARRLEDADGVPAGVLAWIARDPGAEESTLRTVVEIVTERLGELPGGDPVLLSLLASLQQRLGLDEAALDTLTRLDRVQPSESTRWARLALYGKLGRWGESADVLGAMIEEGPYPHLRGTYIRMLGKAGRVEEQSRQIEVLLEERPDAADSGVSAVGLSGHPHLGIVMMAAWDLRDAGNDREAERLLRRVLEIDPDHEGARAMQIHLYGTAEERQALAAAEGARWGGEEDPRSLFDEGTRRLTAGDAQGAIELLRKAAPQLPDLEAAWYNLGMAAYRLEAWDTVASAFERAAALNPRRAETFFFRGIALAKLERCSDATGALESALSLDPQRTLAHYYLWLCYSSLGDREAAARHRQLYDASR